MHIQHLYFPVPRLLDDKLLVYFDQANRQLRIEEVLSNARGLLYSLCDHRQPQPVELKGLVKLFFDPSPELTDLKNDPTLYSSFANDLATSAAPDIDVNLLVCKFSG